MKKIPLSKNGNKFKLFLWSFLIIGSFFISLYFLDLDFNRFFSRLENTPKVIARMMGFNFNLLVDLMKGFATTFFLVVIGVFVSVLISFVLAFLAADNIAPSKILSGLIKGIVAIIRSIPSLILTIIVIASIGFGNTSGLISIIIAGVSFLTKTFSSVIESSGNNVIEAIRSTGSSWFGIVIHGLLPTVFSGFISWTTLEIEQAVNLSISMGTIGIAGIGLLLSNAQRTYQYKDITTIVVFIFILMYLLELITTTIREKLNDNN
ncbi:PhnE/PtxC family ABC transporter permease [Fundicoccus culcitae]|uniref:ABC transporter permease subunit n=1 Tax=Fundicoccus culcitae TaxID=2969821 RepID=A0ABY5P2R9_9LACT|nr:ABC transporter permease subunit [Fundicoccus culcitae]UUX32748.1 ABC transporter permease subunit [Fundicoccus culcitae]